MRWFLALTLCLAMGTVSADNDSPPKPQSPDIRLLVDVSGSMGRTDPDNLRRPAVSLLVRLMPPDSMAGIWTFGQEVNPLIPHAPVDAAWKERALGQLDAINSVALYTNIGGALEQAAFDLEERLDPDGAGPPVDIVLLTDGMVDISPDEAVNRREEVRIMEELLPRLREAGYRVHTLGLSEEADEPLLRDMARTSDGVFRPARNAADLMDALLEIVQQALPAQQLPIEAGQFRVDERVDEFTVLVRRGPDQPAVRLRDPDGNRYQRTDRREGLNWHHTEDYDLITRADPAAGVWELDLDPEAHSRVTVLSDLQLVVKPLPNNWVVGQDLELEFALRDGEDLVDDPEILSLLDFDAEFAGPEEEDFRAQRWYRDPPEDGIYRMSLSVPRTPGQYRLDLRLDGNTFQRLFSHQLAVASQFSVQFEKQEDGADVHWDLTVTATGAVNPGATDLVAHVRSSLGFSRLRAMESTEPGVWHLRVTPEERANYRIGLRASGELSSGEAFSEELPTQYFRFPEDDRLRALTLDDMISEMRDGLTERREAVERARSGEESIPIAQRLPEQPDGADPTATSPPREGDSGTSPIWLYTSLVLVNGLLLLLAYLGYRLITKGASAGSGDDDEDAEETLDRDPPPPMQQIAAEPKPVGGAASEGAGVELSDEDLELSLTRKPAKQDSAAEDQTFSDETPPDEAAGEQTFSDQMEPDDDEPLFPLEDDSNDRKERDDRNRDDNDRS